MTTCPIDGAEMAPGAEICRGCTNNLQLDLRDVPPMLDQLDLTLSRQDSRTGQGISDPEAPPVDYDVDAGTAAAAIRRALTVAGRAWLKTADLSPERLPAVDRLYATWKGKAALIASTRGLHSADWAPTLAVDLRAAIRAAEAAIDRPPDVLLVGWCGSVTHDGRGPALYAVKGAGIAKCRACGLQVDVEDNRELLLALATTERGTAADIGKAFGKPAGTIRSWAARGLLTVEADAAGRPTYALIEVRQLVFGQRPTVPSARATTPPEGVPCQS